MYKEKAIRDGRKGTRQKMGGTERKIPLERQLLSSKLRDARLSDKKG